jgi:hypothetical protein
MSSPFRTAKFNKLKDKWYKKLEKEGFVDCEQDEDNLKQWDSSIFSRYNQHTIGAKQEYYSLAGVFLHTKEFESPRHKLIWTFHAEGLSLDDISLKIKKLGYKRWSRSTVHIIITNLAKEMMKTHGNPIDKPARPNSH